MHKWNVQAFDGYVKGLLRRRYPPEMMVELQTAFGGALADLADAFPENTYCQTTNLQRFLKVAHTAAFKLVPFTGALSILQLWSFCSQGLLFCK